MKLAEKWETDGLAAKTIRNRVSVFRTFSKMIGKHGMIKETVRYVKNPDTIKVRSVAEADKTWSAAGIDITQKITEIYQKNQRIGMQLLLQSAFGLRVKESALIKPHLADKREYLYITHGAKGGRDRVVRIENEFQRAVIDKELDRFARLSVAEVAGHSREDVASVYLGGK